MSTRTVVAVRLIPDSASFASNVTVLDSLELLFVGLEIEMVGRVVSSTMESVAGTDWFVSSAWNTFT